MKSIFANGNSFQTQVINWLKIFHAEKLEKHPLTKEILKVGISLLKKSMASPNQFEKILIGTLSFASMSYAKSEELEATEGYFPHASNFDIMFENANTAGVKLFIDQIIPYVGECIVTHKTIAFKKEYISGLFTDIEKILPHAFFAQYNLNETKSQLSCRIL